ncbi:hypothetical protein Pmar_PMAR005331 [Perkinsus marinus ATCC 50983]|uniref:WW domain-containing protein n=1 Tax=Perkinsus marinus (strain ATCC 50983 / TXsc) TaxID=423536 RepID=C5KB94_PERM5|nr:hypothetical protein Pmar_PMAR005331 [Perkinsus marinus ATCC 50983]EER18420.1 hypothetical protein Pmar_PMAR005331 [Perkinsus marinus ATCC 50983]|eukprot:XP_002786624.1 hypothetical protein Pmar_PMAR005331 [Perkinsus marinus ATCC 50983]
MPIDSNRLRNRLTTDEAMHTSGTIAPSQRPSPIERRPIATVERTEETGGLGVAEGWEELRTEDGTPYYHNKATGHTQWEKPTGSSLPGGWQEFRADDGSSYYYNEATGVTQWERPGTLPEGWQEFRTADGTPYYYHEASSKTVWERPGGGEEVPVGLEQNRVTGTTQSTVAEASIEASKEGGEDTAVVLEGWREFKTDDGTTYYYNESTGVTQWERPGKQPRRVELLVGWEELKADDGTPYYYNSTTGVTQWELPIAMDSRRGDGETPSGKRAREALPDSWEEFHADDGTPYYYNSTTGVTQWELPTESSVVSEEKDVAVTKGALPADWEEFHADDGTSYYYNSTTGQTQWEHPRGAHAEDSGLVKSRVGERKGLPEGWEELIADDGTPYYHQVDTGLTQWEFPTVLSASVNALPEGWQQLKADDGTPYYHNSTTGVTQWDVPSEVRTDKEAPTAAEVAVAALKELPDGWDCVLTPEGRELYFQAGELGRTSTWSRP